MSNLPGVASLDPDRRVAPGAARCRTPTWRSCSWIIAPSAAACELEVGTTSRATAACRPGPPGCRRRPGPPSPGRPSSAARQTGPAATVPEHRAGSRAGTRPARTARSRNDRARLAPAASRSSARTDGATHVPVGENRMGPAGFRRIALVEQQVAEVVGRDRNQPQVRRGLHSGDSWSSGGMMLSIASASPASSRLSLASGLVRHPHDHPVDARPTQEKLWLAASSMNCPSTRRTQR